MELDLLGRLVWERSPRGYTGGGVQNHGTRAGGEARSGTNRDRSCRSWQRYRHRQGPLLLVPGAGRDLGAAGGNRFRRVEVGGQDLGGQVPSKRQRRGRLRCLLAGARLNRRHGSRLRWSAQGSTGGHWAYATSRGGGHLARSARDENRL